MRWIVLSGVCVGLGFEAKMAAGAARRARDRRRLAVGRAARTAGRAVPAARRRRRDGGGRPRLAGAHVAHPGGRPAVDLRHPDNSIWSLIFGYNGLGRLEGQAGGPQAVGGGGGGAGSVFGGDDRAAAPDRRASAARRAGCSAWRSSRSAPASSLTRLRRSDPATGWVIAIGGAFAATAIAFSFAAGSSTPTTSRRSRRSRPPSSAPAAPTRWPVIAPRGSSARCSSAAAR